MNELNSIEYTGTWEKPSRSVTAAAVIGLLGIGTIYFNLESILMAVLLSIYKSVFNIKLSGSMLDKIKLASIYLKAPILFSVTLSEFIFMLLPTIWIIKKWHTKEVLKYLRVNSTSIGEIFLAVLITAFLFPLSSFILDMLVKMLKIPPIIISANSMLFTPNSTMELIFLILAIAITPAICEEILFRGYFQRTLERKLGMKSFLITGILFGLFHMQPLSLISLMLLGVLFSFFYYRSKSIFPSSAAHFTNNFLVLLLLYLKPKDVGINNASEIDLSVWWIIISSLISVGLFILYLKQTKAKTEKAIENGGVVVKE